MATYLTRIAINLSLNELKRRKRKTIFFKDNPTDNELEVPAADQSFLYDGTNEIIQQGIQQLEPKFRSVVVLRLVEGYSTNETAKILKIPTGTVLSRLARAQKKLKEILSPMIQETL